MEESIETEDAARLLAIPCQSHAWRRWAATIRPILESAVDIRTTKEWSRLIGASSGALAAWCRIAGITPRRSLTFARLLRASLHWRQGRGRLEDLLDVVDRRTLVGLLRSAGFDGIPLPSGGYNFLARQTLIADPSAIAEIAALLDELMRPSSSAPLQFNVDQER